MTHEAINLSALNQYAYCPRRCGLIYLEGEFDQNVHTARGNAEHERVDCAAHLAGKDGARLDYALPVWSQAAGLIGKCDVVEHWPDGTLFPVEYKHGPRRKWLNDDLQLTAQAICLEEMFGRPVPAGAIYHASSRRRREVTFTPELRALVAQTAEAIRAMLTSGRLPPPVNDQRCRECSLKDLCQPEAIAARTKQRALRDTLFDPNGAMD
ncbi:CRISPR-associated protein Cas4 [Thiorhodococcus mannitoliphagus]|uniref:CRISPR-associated exonuclease Cas4 n=1 Tax=Thiorhodococcus mannitoliphagus TaxID=329406 RepID=A0A6P1DUK3_9GAMM|nr:CRISPR-associated protein Cas4 [Thiorhodococcus mannitoliphagus]NEX20651.1 CRISPR-associated protein Cas4 [Thiorhodococcus mannitoliphagus]